MEVFGDENFAGCISTRKSTVGGVVLWSGQCVKAWSKKWVFWPLSSGESELAAVVRAATEGWGLQSTRGGFGLFGYVAIESDASVAIGMVHRLELGKVRHLAVGDLWVQHHVRSEKIRVSQMSGLENPSDAQTKYLWARTTGAPCESMLLGTCRGRVVIDSKVGQEGLFCRR